MSAMHDHLRSLWPEIGDGLAATFQTLHDDPEATRCEDLAIRLDGARRHVLALAEAAPQPIEPTV